MRSVSNPRLFALFMFIQTCFAPGTRLGFSVHIGMIHDGFGVVKAWGSVIKTWCSSSMTPPFS
jgi:hypothetical protein